MTALVTRHEVGWIVVVVVLIEVMDTGLAGGLTCSGRVPDFLDHFATEVAVMRSVAVVLEEDTHVFGVRHSLALSALAFTVVGPLSFRGHSILAFWYHFSTVAPLPSPTSSAASAIMNGSPSSADLRLPHRVAVSADAREGARPAHLTFLRT